MRVTVMLLDHPERVLTLVDGSWMNHRWLGGEILGLEKQGIDGWYDSLSPRDADPQAIPQQDGSYWPAMVNVAHRVVTVRGVHRGSSSLHVARFRDILAALVGEALEVRVDDASGARSAQGFVSAQIPATLTDARTTRFSLIVTCPDPLKYGPEVLFTGAGGAVTVENTGTGDVFPRFDVAGPVSEFSASLGDSTVQWAGPSGVGLSLDMSDGLPLRGGSVVGTLVQDDLIKIPPGVSTVSVSATAGASVQVAVKPGWK